MKDNYEVKVFNDTSLSPITSAAARIHNKVVEAINKHSLLPKAIVIIMDDAIIRMVHHRDYGVSEIYGALVKNLMVGLHRLILSHKESLPTKSRKFNYPTILWALCPLNKGFPESWNTFRKKFNNCLEACSVLYGEMQILRLKKFWEYQDESLVKDKKLSAAGYQAFWCSVDSAFRHWNTFIFNKNAKSKIIGKQKFPTDHTNRTKNDFVAKEYRRFQEKRHWQKRHQRRQEEDPEANHRTLPQLH